MRFEFNFLLHTCISAVETFAIFNFFTKLLIRKYKKSAAYIALYSGYFLVNVSLSAFVGATWARGAFGMLFPFAAALIFYSENAPRRVFIAGLLLVFHLMTEPTVMVFVSWLTGHIFPAIPSEGVIYFLSAGLATLLYFSATAIIAYRGKAQTAVHSKHYALLALMILLCLSMSYIDLWTIRRGTEITLIHVVRELCVYSMPVLIFYVAERFQEYAFLETRAKMLDAQLLQNEKQFKLMDAHQAAIRKLRHDVKGQLMTLREMATRGSKGDLLDYINEYSESIALTLDSTYTGLSSTDAVIAYMKRQAESSGISFDVRIPHMSDVEINPVHLNNILINALNNAIEGCLALPDGSERRIELGLKCDGEFLFIRVINTAPPVKIESGGFPATTKKDKTAHGIGLESMLESVEKYGGIMTVDYTEPNFMLLIRARNSASPQTGRTSKTYNAVDGT
jgi:signal transduction histidine kinase